jgi:hypothetical protein
MGIYSMNKCTHLFNGFIYPKAMKNICQEKLGMNAKTYGPAKLRNYKFMEMLNSEPQSDVPCRNSAGIHSCTV